MGNFKFKQLAEESLFPSVTYIIGYALTRRLRTQFASITGVLYNEQKPDKDGIEVLFVTKDKIGRSLAVILLSSTVTNTQLSYFPYIPDFNPDDTPL